MQAAYWKSTAAQQRNDTNTHVAYCAAMCGLRRVYRTNAVSCSMPLAHTVDRRIATARITRCTSLNARAVVRRLHPMMAVFEDKSLFTALSPKLHSLQLSRSLARSMPMSGIPERVCTVQFGLSHMQEC